jgi:putative tryptophan/tyrosine transport system substrate-binding protein
VAARSAGTGGGAHLSPRRFDRWSTHCAVFCGDELRRAGFIEGQNLTIYWHPYGLDIDLLPGLAAELVKLQVDVIYATGDLAILAAQRATTTIPILGAANDMVRSGLVNSLARPDGNTTGFSIFAPELDGKRQEILIEVVPGLRRIAVLVDANMTTTTQLQALQDAARGRNIELSTSAFWSRCGPKWT